MIIKMMLPDVFRYRRCVAAQTRVEQLENFLVGMDAETILYEEWNECVHTAKNSMETLEEILHERARSYVERGTI